MNLGDFLIENEVMMRLGFFFRYVFSYGVVGISFSKAEIIIFKNYSLA